MDLISIAPPSSFHDKEKVVQIVYCCNMSFVTKWQSYLKGSYININLVEEDSNNVMLLWQMMTQQLNPSL